MEYTADFYRRHTGRVLTTTDGHKYLKCKVKRNKTYINAFSLATTKLQMDTNIILPIANISFVQ